MKLMGDHPATLEFALQSGKLIQNFGVIELLSYRWIEVLSGSSIAMEISMELPLAKRIDVILKLIARGSPSLSSEAAGEAKQLWSQLKDKGCEIRNSVAHGTMGLKFPQADTSKDPEEIGILRLKKWSDTDQMISVEEVKAAVNTTSSIAKKLNGIL
jgi:hypothetical protein